MPGGNSCCFATRKKVAGKKYAHLKTTPDLFSVAGSEKHRHNWVRLGQSEALVSICLHKLLKEICSIKWHV